MTNEEVIEVLKELWRSEHTDRYSEKEIRNAIELAIETIEKQIPKKPYKIYNIPFFRFCPTCNDKCCEEGENIYYCWSCGQRLD